MADGSGAWPPDIDPKDPNFQALLKHYLQDAIDRFRVRRDRAYRVHDARNGGTAGEASDETSNGAADEPISYGPFGALHRVPYFSRAPDVKSLNEELESLRRKMVGLVIENSGLEKTNNLLQGTISECDTLKVVVDKLQPENERLMKEVRQLTTQLKHSPGDSGGHQGVGKQGKSRTLAEEVLPSLQHTVTELKENLTKDITKRLVSLPRHDDPRYSISTAQSAPPSSQVSQLFKAALSDRDVVTFFSDLDISIERVSNMILRYKPIVTDKWENFAQYEKMRSLFLRWYIGLKLFKTFFRYEPPMEPSPTQTSDTSHRPPDEHNQHHIAKITELEELIDKLAQSNIDIDQTLYPRLAAEYLESVISSGLSEFYAYPPAIATEARNLVKLALIQIAEDACKLAHRINWNADHGRSRYRYVWLQDYSPFPLDRDETEVLSVFHAGSEDPEYGWMCFGGVRRHAGAGTGLVSGELEEKVLLRKSKVWYWNEPTAQGGK
ncbi:hypothetical protein BU16DRAFT_566336 [Lophium mytilinum]|uniref:Uncharacterized protein n=1 Tax=Lophium mytilinum TaxID=390894 RepID=A0A6A6QE44_9PEZI|nr:hypothetical protein BU16DRAFT_566336 [Lophium mytilinum]